MRHQNKLEREEKVNEVRSTSSDKGPAYSRCPGISDHPYPQLLRPLSFKPNEMELKRLTAADRHP